MNPFGMFGGLLGPPRLLSEQLTAQEMQTLIRPGAILQYNPQKGIPFQYSEGMVNNRQVECAYCRTPRMSMHKECKGCGASEVMG